MLRRSLLLTTFFISLFALLLVAIGFPAQRLFASASTQSATSGVPLSQPVTVTVQQQIPFTITLVTSEVITSATTPTETVTQPVTQTTVITFDVQMEVVVSESGVITTPISIRLRSSQQPTNTFPVKSSLALGRNLRAQLGLEVPPLPEPTAEVTTTPSLTETSELTETTAPTTTSEVTSTASITTSTVPTTSEALTTTEQLTTTATPTTSVATTATTTGAFNATLSAISNIRSDTNLDATSVVTQLAAGTPISVVAQSADQSWLLLDSGYWVSILVVDAVPANLPQATEAQIAALRQASSSVALPAPTPVATAVPTTTLVATPTVEATTPTTPTVTGPTVTVDANLRSGPGTEFEVLGGTITGQAITIVGRNVDGSWFRLDNGGWVASRLVANPPSNETVPVVNNDGSPATAPAEAATPTEAPLLLPTATPTP
ncbi:MAG: SH3 domain-containing protein [Caldilineaceae bacterium]